MIVCFCFLFKLFVFLSTPTLISPILLHPRNLIICLFMSDRYNRYGDEYSRRDFDRAPSGRREPDSRSSSYRSYSSDRDMDRGSYGRDYGGERYRDRYSDRDRPRRDYGYSEGRERGRYLENGPSESAAPRRPAPRPSERRRELEDRRYERRDPAEDAYGVQNYRYPEEDRYTRRSRVDAPPEPIYEEEDNVVYEASGRVYDPQPQSSTPSVRVSKKDGLQGLIGIVNKIQEVFAVVGNNVLDMPQIAVVGGQSSGKSSVLENIVGKDFLPRGSGIVTRRPLILQLIYDETTHDGSCVSSLTQRLRRVSPPEGSEVLRLRRDSRRDRGGHDPGDGRGDLRVGASDHPEDPLSERDQPDADRPSRHHSVGSPSYCNDISVPVGDQPKDIEVIIRRMVLKFIRQPNCIIMAVTAANTDLANSDAIQLAREVDPEGLRTVGVITKLDLMDRGTDAYGILTNRLIPLRLGYVGVINRGQRDIDSRKNMQQQWRDEETFLRQNYPDIAGRNGTRFLREKLNALLLQHIRQCLPSIITRVNEFKAEKTLLYGGMMRDRRELETMSVGLSTLPQMQIAFFQSVSAFSRRYCALLDGRGSEEREELEGGARIRYVFQRGVCVGE